MPVSLHPDKHATPNAKDVFEIMTQKSIQEDNAVGFLGRLETHDNLWLRYAVRRREGGAESGSVILLGGRSEFIEKHAETTRELNQRSFDVYSLDWRGQGLSSRMLPNRRKGFVHSYGDYIRDMARFVDTVVEPRAVTPIVILAHSMGGHIALRYLRNHPGTADRAILLSPMFDILTWPFPRVFAKLLARWAVKRGFEHAYAIGSGDRFPSQDKFEGNRLTSDPDRFLDEKRAVEKNPDLALGGVTYGWLSATFDSIETIAQPGYAEKISTPLLIVSAGSDRIVCRAAQKRLCAGLKHCRLVVIPGARHEILKETDAVRSAFWKAFDRFTGAAAALRRDGRNDAL